MYVKPEDGHYQAPKHVALPYVENALHSTNKYSCVRPVHTLYIIYFTEYNVDDEPHVSVAKFADILSDRCNVLITHYFRAMSLPKQTHIIEGGLFWDAIYCSYIHIYHLTVPKYQALRRHLQ
jgi:hypothetical protein